MSGYGHSLLDASETEGGRVWGTGGCSRAYLGLLVSKLLWASMFICHRVHMGEVRLTESKAGPGNQLVPCLWVAYKLSPPFLLRHASVCVLNIAKAGPPFQVIQDQEHRFFFFKKGCLVIACTCTRNYATRSFKQYSAQNLRYLLQGYVRYDSCLPRIYHLVCQYVFPILPPLKINFLWPPSLSNYSSTCFLFNATLLYSLSLLSEQPLLQNLSVWLLSHSPSIIHWEQSHKCQQLSTVVRFINFIFHLHFLSETGFLPIIHYMQKILSQFPYQLLKFAYCSGLCCNSCLFFFLGLSHVNLHPLTYLTPKSRYLAPSLLNEYKFEIIFQSPPFPPLHHQSLTFYHWSNCHNPPTCLVVSDFMPLHPSPL